MGKRGKKPQVTIDIGEFKEYVESGMYADDIAKRIGVDVGRIRKYASMHNIVITRKRPVGKKEEQSIIAMFDEGKKYKDIADATGRCMGTIRYILASHNRARNFKTLQEDLDDMVSMAREGKSDVEIAEWIGCSSQLVHYHLAKRDMRGTAISPRYWTQKERNLLVTLYGQGVKITDIATILDRSVGSVTQKCNEMHREGVIAYRREI